MARLSPPARLSTLLSSVRERATSLRASAARGARRARDLMDEARREAEAVARRAGVPVAPQPEPPTIDVGETPPFALRLAHAAAGALVLALLFGGAVSLGLFIVQVLLAYLLSTRVLGIRVDIAPPKAA